MFPWLQDIKRRQPWIVLCLSMLCFIFCWITYMLGNDQMGCLSRSTLKLNTSNAWCIVLQIGKIYNPYSNRMKVKQIIMVTAWMFCDYAIMNNVSGFFLIDFFKWTIVIGPLQNNKNTYSISYLCPFFEYVTLWYEPLYNLNIWEESVRI